MAQGTATFGPVDGHAHEVLLLNVPAHGASAAAPLEVEWQTAGTPSAVRSGLAVTADTLAIGLPEGPPGTYDVRVRQGAALVAQGAVVHLGALTPADPPATVTAVLDELEAYIGRAWTAAFEGRLPLDFRPYVVDTFDQFALVRAEALAAPAAHLYWVAEVLRANEGNLATLHAGLVQDSTRLCATPTTVAALAGLGTLDARAGAIATGYLVAEHLGVLPSVSGGSLGVALGELLDHMALLRQLELLHSALEEPVVLLPSPLLDCLGVVPLQPVTVGVPFVVALRGEARGPEASDATATSTSPALAAALARVADALARAGDLRSAFSARRALPLALLPAVAAVPSAGARGQLAPDSAAIAWMVAVDASGASVPATFEQRADARLALTLEGGQPGAHVVVTFEVTQPGVAAPTQHQLSLALADPAVPLPFLVHLPAGTFTMGSPGWAGGPFTPGAAPVGPIHDVTLTRPFWIGAHEVTQAELAAFSAVNPSAHVGPTLPVEGISWDAALAYCADLTAYQAARGNVPAGYAYRLPTEAEWEYACRAGTTTEFHVGPLLTCSAANFWTYGEGSFCTVYASTPVGSYAPNPWGLYDMHGNVLEWCLDSLAPYPAGAVVDPFVTGGPARVQRGGGWRDRIDACRSGARGGAPPSEGRNDRGFRVVLGPILAY